MATVNQVGVGLSGATGTGSFAGSASPTFTGTPILSTPTATSLTFSSTSGIIGTTTNNNAAAGSVGEYMSSTVLSGAAVSVSNNTATDILTLSLTAGDWDVWGVIRTNPSVGTTTSSYNSWISTTSATIPEPTSTGLITLEVTTAGSAVIGLQNGIVRMSLASTTTVYFSTYITFAVNTMTAYGYMAARRVR